jgi:hypothetical protein
LSTWSALTAAFLLGSVAAAGPVAGSAAASLAGPESVAAAGPSAGGWTIIAVHESQASWEKFRDGILMPRMQQGITGGFPTPPEETAIAVDTLMP